MYVYSAITKCGAPVAVRFLTLRGARCFADSVLLRVRHYSIERGGLFLRKIPLIIALALTLTFCMPLLAFADDEPSSSAAAIATNEQVENGEAQQRIDYTNVVNEQVVGDFFFVMCADSVLLVLILGALCFLAFKPTR